jgi:hypothetical protein
MLADEYRTVECGLTAFQRLNTSDDHWLGAVVLKDKLSISKKRGSAIVVQVPVYQVGIIVSLIDLSDLVSLWRKPGWECPRRYLPTVKGIF